MADAVVIKPSILAPTGIDEVDRVMDDLAAQLQGVASATEDALNATPPASATPPADPVSLTYTSSIDTASGTPGQSTDVAVVFSWAAVPGAVRYRFQLNRSGQTDQYETTTVATTIRLTPLISGVVYDFRVKAIDKWEQESGWASASTASTPGDTTNPATVTGLGVTQGIRALLISWTPSTDSDLRDYRVQVSTVSDFSSAIVADFYVRAVVASFQPTTPVTSATTYYVRVKAYDQSGNASAAWSSTANAQLGVSAARLAVDELTAGNLTVTMTFSGGTIQTGSTGKRVVITSTSQEQLALYTGDAGENRSGYVGVDVSGSGTTAKGRIFLLAPRFYNSTNDMAGLVFTSTAANNSSASEGYAGFYRGGAIDGVVSWNGTEDLIRIRKAGMLYDNAVETSSSVGNGSSNNNIAVTWPVAQFSSAVNIPYCAVGVDNGGNSSGGNGLCTATVSVRSRTGANVSIYNGSGATRTITAMVMPYTY